MPKKIVKKSNNLFKLEDRALNTGYLRIAGVDEAGVGPLAGPVAAAAVIIKDRVFSERIDDSKKLTEKQRKRAYLEIQKKCEVGIATASVAEVDRLNIYRASSLAMERAVRELSPLPDHILIDGRNKELDLDISMEFFTGGESLSLSIACASIVAKVYRDTIMCQLHENYPEYGFDRHKGYGTRSHLESIGAFGVCPIHRRSFRPCRVNDND